MAMWYDIPRGTDDAKCPRGCGATVHWIEARRSGGTVRIPVDTDIIGGTSPDSLSAGRGVNHFGVCPNPGPGA